MVVAGVVPGGFGEVADSGQAERADDEVTEAGLGAGALLERSQEASSANVVSLTRCDLFSIVQCWRTRSAIWAGLVGFERGDGLNGLAGLLLAFGLAAAALELDGGERAENGQPAGRWIDPADLDRAGLRAPCPVSAACEPRPTSIQGRLLSWRYRYFWLAFTIAT